MALSKGFQDLAERLEEAATALSHDDIRSRLGKKLSTKVTNGDYAYPIDVFGDDKSGNVVYSHSGKIKRAPYKAKTTEGNADFDVDMEKAEEVHPRTTYETKSKEAVDPTCIDPDPATTIESANVEITGDVIPLKEGAVGQDGTAYLKLIAPGRGSCGYYPAEVIERDGPKIFKKGTKNFWNHQTDAEEAARPEGDLRDLASVLSEDAHYEANGPAGAGLYAKAKVFENFRQPVDDLAKHIGMSIRASGKAKEGKAPDGKTGPIIEQLTRGISVDYVTTPGAGGKVLQLFEAARGAAKPTVLKEAKPMPDVDNAEITKLQESHAALAVENRKLRERFALSDAADEGKKYFATVRVGEAIQERVLGRVLAGKIPLTESGDLDKAKLTALVEAETKDEVAYVNKLSGGKVVVSMGSGEQPTLTEAEKTQQSQQRVAEGQAFGSLFGFDKPNSVGNRIMREGRSAFDPSYNAADKKEVVQ